MLAANVPGRIALPFANGAGVGYKNPIPVASQVGITPGAASYTDGFPPLCFLPLTAGGIAPSGADFNGLLNAITAVQQWQSAGGLFHYDSTFSTAIGGYPAGAMIIGASNTTTWLNLADNNTTNPDAIDGSAANWVPADAYGIAPISGLTNASVTLLPAQWSKPVITLTGTLTANINIIFPTTAQKWLVVNNTTGAFVVTCKTAAGAGAPVAQGGGQQTFWGDGTNLNALAGNSALPFVVGTATAPTHALNQAAGDARYAPLSSSRAGIPFDYPMGNKWPSNGLLMNGTSVSSTVYHELFLFLVSYFSGATISIGSPAAIVWAAHGLYVNAPVKFTTTVALPTGIVAGTTYFVIATGFTTDTFRISATIGGAAINTSGSQSGVHTAIHAPYGCANDLSAFNVPNVVADYTIVQSSSGNEGTATVGQVIAHTHTANSTAVSNFEGTGGTALNSPGGGVGVSSTGGPANLAAGVRMRKYIYFV